MDLVKLSSGLNCSTTTFISYVHQRAAIVVLMALMEACLQDHLVSDNFTRVISFRPSSFCFVRNKLCGTEEDTKT